MLSFLAILRGGLLIRESPNDPLWADGRRLVRRPWQPASLWAAQRASYESPV